MNVKGALLDLLCSQVLKFSIFMIFQYRQLSRPLFSILCMCVCVCVIYEHVIYLCVCVYVGERTCDFASSLASLCCLVPAAPEGVPLACSRPGAWTPMAVARELPRSPAAPLRHQDSLTPNLSLKAQRYSTATGSSRATARASPQLTVLPDVKYPSSSGTN